MEEKIDIKDKLNLVMDKLSVVSEFCGVALNYSIIQKRLSVGLSSIIDECIDMLESIEKKII